MIEVSNLTVRFGGVTSLNYMAVTFEPGTNGLIGPNGAGKTTFFNVLSGFVRPAQGNGRSVRRWETSREARRARTGRGSAAREGRGDGRPALGPRRARPPGRGSGDAAGG